jgi:hypothetical protein
MKMPVMKDENLTEIIFNGIKYSSIGRFMNIRGGIIDHFPESQKKTDWHTFLLSEEPCIQIMTLGLLCFYFREHKQSFKDCWGPELYDILDRHHTFYIDLVNKWYKKEFEGMKSKHFLDFKYGFTLNKVKNENGQGNDIVFKDGSVLKFNDKRQSWDDIHDHYFVPSDNYRDLLKDISALTALFGQ